MVTMDKFIVLRKFKKVEETIAGTINKIEKGFVIPPVRYNNKDNWIRSRNKTKVEEKLFNWLFLNPNRKYMLVKIPLKIIIEHNKKGSWNLKTKYHF